MEDALVWINYVKVHVKVGISSGKVFVFSSSAISVVCVCVSRWNNRRSFPQGLKTLSGTMFCPCWRNLKKLFDLFHNFSWKITFDFENFVTTLTTPGVFFTSRWKCFLSPFFKWLNFQRVDQSNFFKKRPDICKVTSKILFFLWGSPSSTYLPLKLKIKLHWLIFVCNLLPSKTLHAFLGKDFKMVPVSMIWFMANWYRWSCKFTEVR